MKKFIYISLAIVFAVLINSRSNAQCPVEPACTQTAVSGTSYVVAAGTVLCITSNYNAGTLTVSGGTVIIQSGGNLNSGATVTMTSGTIHVASGGTLTKDITPTSASTINNCGTVSGTRNFNSNVTLNNYSTATLALRYGGNVTNNYANNATISFGTVDVSGGVLNNYGTNLKFSITGSWNQGVTFNNAVDASMEVTSVPGGAMPASTVFNNAGNLVYTPVLNTTGATFNNAKGGTLNFTSSASANRPNITNNGTVNVSGTFYLAGGTTTNNGTMNFSDELRMDGGTLNLGTNSTTTTKTLYKNNGTINMNDHSLLNITENITTWNGTPINLVSGCASIIGSTTPSTTNINSNLLGNSNLNFCGSAPMQSGGTIRTITSVADNGSGAYRITMASGPANLQYIQIAGVTGVSNLNGYWQVIRINATTFDLVGSMYTPGASFGSSQVQVDQSKLKLGTSTYLGYSGCANPCAPLPVKLVAFSAVKENGIAKITWQTIEEKNNDYYVIERSTDGIHFEHVTTVKGNRNSSSLITYNEYDYSPYAGISYYKLKQVDLDGSFTYSSIAAIQFNNETDWVIYPNPSKDGSFTIMSAFADNEIVTVTVTDVTGNRVRNYDAGSYAQELKVSDLSSGLYIVNIQTVSQLLSKKLVIE
jgi:hypothetical protein